VKRVIAHSLSLAGVVRARRLIRDADVLEYTDATLAARTLLRLVIGSREPRIAVRTLGDPYRLPAVHLSDRGLNQRARIEQTILLLASQIVEQLPDCAPTAAALPAADAAVLHAAYLRMVGSEIMRDVFVAFYAHYSAVRTPADTVSVLLSCRLRTLLGPIIEGARVDWRCRILWQ
jgi:hypothetical protein